jgi:hypothetical protein
MQQLRHALELWPTCAFVHSCGLHCFLPQPAVQYEVTGKAGEGTYGVVYKVQLELSFTRSTCPTGCHQLVLNTCCLRSWQMQ